MADGDEPETAPPAGSAAPPGRGTTVVAKLRVRPGAETAFAAWQDEVGAALAGWPGFVQQTLVPPSPPVDDRWTILQWFERDDAADAWLASPQRLRLLGAAGTILAGSDDIHVVRAGAPVAAEPASLVVATRVAPDAEARFRDWQQKIAAVLAGTPGFQGYRVETPAAGGREEWLTVARFSSEAALRAWLDSPGRQALLAEAETITLDRKVRTVDSAFEQWRPAAERSGEPAAWKMSMLVLAVLYPSVFLLDTFLVPPLAEAGLQPWLTIFIGNVFCVLVLGLLVPRVARLFGWWLSPPAGKADHPDAAGACVVVGLYATTLLAFAAFWHTVR